MTNKMHRLPFECILEISKYMDVDSLVHFSRTNKKHYILTRLIVNKYRSNWEIFNLILQKLNKKNIYSCVFEECLQLYKQNSDCNSNSCDIGIIPPHKFQSLMMLDRFIEKYNLDRLFPNMELINISDHLFIFRSKLHFFEREIIFILNIFSEINICIHNKSYDDAETCIDISNMNADFRKSNIIPFKLFLKNYFAKEYCNTCPFIDEFIKLKFHEL